jgi:hypothetical protein
MFGNGLFLETTATSGWLSRGIGSFKKAVNPNPNLWTAAIALAYRNMSFLIATGESLNWSKFNIQCDYNKSPKPVSNINHNRQPPAFLFSLSGIAG